MLGVVTALLPLAALALPQRGESWIEVVAAGLIVLVTLPAVGPTATASSRTPGARWVRLAVLVGVGSIAGVRDQLSLVAVCILLLVLLAFFASQDIEAPASDPYRYTAAAGAVGVGVAGVISGLGALDLVIWTGLWLLPLALLGVATRAWQRRRRTYA